MDYEEVFLLLNRKYSKDELVSQLNKELREATTEIGQLKSEIAHLEHSLKLCKRQVSEELAKVAGVEIKKEQHWKTIVGHNNRLHKENKNLHKQNADLVGKLAKLKT